MAWLDGLTTEGQRAQSVIAPTPDPHGDFEKVAKKNSLYCQKLLFL